MIKKFVLVLGLLSGVQNIQTRDEELFVAFGAAVLFGGTTLYWLNRESNSEKIKRVDELWNEYQLFRMYTNIATLDLNVLKNSPLMRKRQQILQDFDSITDRYAWYWNQSDAMKKAKEKVTVLNECVVEYEERMVELLWEKLSGYNLKSKFSIHTITLEERDNIVSHPIVQNQHLVKDLYDRICNKTQSFVYYKIDTLDDRRREYMNVVNAINTYESIITSYKDLNHDSVASLKYQYSNSKYPLLSAVSDLQNDIARLKGLPFAFTYIGRKEYFIEVNTDVVGVLSKILKEVLASSAYAQEKALKDQHDYQQKMLKLERDKVKAAQKTAKLKEEQLYLEYEKLKQQKEKDKKKEKKEYYSADQTEYYSADSNVDNSKEYYSADDDYDNYYSA